VILRKGEGLKICPPIASGGDTPLFKAGGDVVFGQGASRLTAFPAEHGFGSQVLDGVQGQPGIKGRSPDLLGKEGAE
jgi:hypothetical protein